MPDHFSGVEGEFSFLGVSVGLWCEELFEFVAFGDDGTGFGSWEFG